MATFATFLPVFQRLQIIKLIRSTVVWRADLGKFIHPDVANMLFFFCFFTGNTVHLTIAIIVLDPRIIILLWVHEVAFVDLFITTVRSRGRFCLVTRDWRRLRPLYTRKIAPHAAFHYCLLVLGCGLNFCPFS